MGRFNRMLKKKMYRYFTAKRTRRYISVLTELIHSYNDTDHRFIDMAPMDVTADSKDVVRKRLYPLKPKTLRLKFNVGDKVSISMQRRPFKKVTSETGQKSCSSSALVCPLHR